MSKNTQFWILISIGLLLIIVINTVIFPSYIAQLDAVSSNVETIFDLSYFYTPDQAYAKIAAFGSQGVPIIHKLTAVDFLYIIIYSFTYYFLLRKYVPTVFPTRKSLQKLAPFVIAVFDICENLGYSTLIRYYPERLDGLAYFTAFSTAIKWSLVAFLVPFWVVVLIGALKKQIVG